MPSRYCPPESKRIISFLPTSLQLSVTALREIVKGTKRVEGEEARENERLMRIERIENREIYIKREKRQKVDYRKKEREKL